MPNTITDSPSSEEQRFLPQVEAHLRQGGWYPERVIDDQRLKNWLIVELSVGLRPIQTRMFPAAWKILQEFGDLIIQTAHQETISFNPLESLWDEFWFVDEWTSEGALFPLGTHTEGSCTYAMAVTGRGQVIDNQGFLIGNTIEDAITNLVVGGQLPVYNPNTDEFRRASTLIPLLREVLGI
jgi:hypothetical protein